MKNPCRSEEWLGYHYLRRDFYIQWCEDNNLDMCPYGGQGLTLTACAELAGVTPQCISNWLHQFGFGTRGLSEAQIGKYNNCWQKPRSAKNRREIRDAFFEQYRAGIMNIIMGELSFSNGLLTSKEETAAKRAHRRSLIT